MLNHNFMLYLAIVGIIVFVPLTQAAVVNSVQSGATSSTGNGIVSVNVTSVDMSKSFLIFQTRHSGNRPVSSTVRGELASSTQLEFTRVSNENSTIVIQWYLIEYTSGVSVQRGSTTQSSTNVSVNLGTTLGSTSDAFLLYSKTAKNTDGAYGNDDPITGIITATNQIQFEANSSNSDHIIEWQVVEFTDNSINVQTGIESITQDSGITVTDNLSSAVDLDSTILLAGWRSSGGGSDIDERLITAGFPSNNTVQFTRGDNGDDDVDKITYQAIEFTDGTAVQSGTANFTSGESSKSVTISTVDTSMAVALATIQAGDGQNKGNTEYSGDDVTGEGSFTMSFASSTSLTIQRSSSNSASTLNWQTIDFSESSDGGGGACASPTSSYGIVAGGGIIIDNDVKMNNINISQGTTGANAAIETDADIAFGAVSIPAVEPEPFPANSSTTDISDSDSPINASGEVFYDEAFVGEDDTLSFTGGGTFHIDTLTADKKSKIRFSAGTYYIDRLIFDDEKVDLIIDSGPVILHIGTSMFAEKKEVDMNKDGDVDDLQILLHSGATISFEEDKFEINAVIIGPNSGELKFGEELKFEGTIQTSNTVTLVKKTRLKLSSSQQADIDTISYCPDGGADDDDDDSGMTCTSPTSDYGIFAGVGIVIPNDVKMNNINISEGTTAANAAIETDADIVFGAVSIPAVEPEPFPANSSTTDINDSDSPINASGEVFYDDAFVGEDDTLSFTGGGTFHIDTLTADKKSKIRFSAGTYYIDRLIFDDEKVDLIIDSGPVILHIGTSMTADKKEVDMNKDGDVDDLQILLHSGATIDFDEKKFKINAVIIGPNSGELKFGEELKFEGTIQTSNKVTLVKKTRLKLSSSQQSDIDSISYCAAAGDVDHFEISHDGSGINCLDEVITFTAADASGNAVEDYAGTTTLDTGSGKGTWSLNSGNGTFLSAIANIGLATYTYHDDDNGVASFNLSYTEGSNTLDIEIYQTSDPTLRDDDNESSLVFDPSGFILTQNLLSNPPPASINDPIVTQTAGSDFTIHITAFGQTPTDSVCGVIEAYTSTQDLAFWFDYENPSSGTIEPTVNTNGLASSEGASSTQSVTFTNGKSSVTSKYRDVGKIQIHTKDGTISGGTAPFVVKPSTIFITDIETNGGTNNPAATTATGTGFVAAGESFTVTVEVRGSDGAVTPNFGNESSAEGIELIASSLVIPASGRNGSSDNGAIGNASVFSATASAGTFSGTQFSWDEYGIIKLQASISDDNYLGVGEITGPESGAVGRFYPVAFALTTSGISAACNGFTYMNQPALALSYNLEAQGNAGNKLFNYDLVLLGSSGVSSPSLDLENSNQGTNLSSRLTTGASSWINGRYSYSTLIASFNRAASADGPYTGLAFGVSANDLLDSRLIGGLDTNATTNTDCVSAGNCNSRTLAGSSQIYYGRLEVSNTFGPETEALDITMNASYFDGSGYVVNSSDDCTGYINTDATLSNYQGGLPVVTVTAPTAINLLQNGKTHLSAPLLISAPGAGNTGSVDLTYDAPAWLEFDWNGSGAEDPSGTASFGHFRGHDKVIYWHEVLN